MLAQTVKTMRTIILSSNEEHHREPSDKDWEVDEERIKKRNYVRTWKKESFYLNGGRLDFDRLGFK
jgi:hypothetical protein